MTNETTNPSIYSALAKAQAEFLVARKNRKAQYGMYADLSSCLDAIRPALNKYGLFISQDVKSTNLEVSVVTIIHHESGESIRSGELIIPIGGKAMNAAQQMGSALTYARRYSLCSFLGIVGDDDDDGQSSGNSGDEKPKGNSPSDELLMQAEDEANKGTVAFRAYWKRLDLKSRDLLKAHMNRLQSIAATADKRNQEPPPNSGISKADDGTYHW